MSTTPDNNGFGSTQDSSSGSTAAPTNATPPSLSLPKGGGALSGIGEKFQVNAVNGTANFSIPVATSPGRSGFGPSLQLSYDSGAGNGPFGTGWDLSLPEITRKTDKGLPRYADDGESDVFILSGAEDLVPVLTQREDTWHREHRSCTVDGIEYSVRDYRPRVEGMFARIERWTATASSEIFWRTISRENITSVFGRTADSRVADPRDPRRVFKWLLSESYDSVGNAIVYEYKRENDENVDVGRPHECNRAPADRTANRYIKRIRYGNCTPVAPNRSCFPFPEGAGCWMFDVVFDYGEHDPANPKPDDDGRWTCRQYPFSTYRACFEIRTYRLCRRILMFHHFPDEPGVGNDCLVSSLDLRYTEAQVAEDDREPVVTAIDRVTMRGYRRADSGGYVMRSHPPIEFEYTRAEVHEQIREIDPLSLQNMPGGASYRWIDLDSEGLSGLFYDEGNAWRYKRNLGQGRFGPLETVMREPSFTDQSDVQLMDVTGDGLLDAVSFSNLVPGFFERRPDRNWSDLRSFVSLPNLDWNDPNVRFVDVDGDGLSDVLITQDEVFTVYPSLGSMGFGPPQDVFRPKDDEDDGPRLVMSEADNAIYLADMSGDGLSDLVRIRNGEVCYWPSEGYGRFGRKVVLDRSPWFELPDLFDPARIRLVDIDGSGTTDIIYLGQDGARLFFNRSGNGFSDPYELRTLPALDNSARVDTIDLMGNGTACLVWSTPAPFDQLRDFRYVELMGGQKPHLLSVARNNLGAETRLAYASSTQFYFEDAAAGRPWATRLPFPVHVVVKTTVVDVISHNQFVTRYAYHHGYYDGFEREFRGFGMVEQWDTEEIGALSGKTPNPTDLNVAWASLPANIDPVSQTPPVHTKTWFHLGDYLQDGRISHRYESEYYQEPGHGQALLLPDSELPPGLTIFEEREACRSLKGSQLRSEVYADDGSERAERPYSVSERNFEVRMLQPVGPNKHASFFTFGRESLSLQYERALYPIDGKLVADPRVGHKLTLAVDDYGNVLESASITYGRRHDDHDPRLTHADRDRQKRLWAMYTVHGYTNVVDTTQDYRTPALCEALAYELVKISPCARSSHGANLFGFSEVRDLVCRVSDGRHDLPYQDFEAKGVTTPHRRLIGHTRTVFRGDDLTGPLPFGRLEAKALPFESYQLALTPDLVRSAYDGRVTDAMLASDGRYVHALGDPNWWTVSGRVYFSPDGTDELAYARRHFFRPCRFIDPFGNMSTVAYDPYDLLVQETRDAMGNQVTAGEREIDGHVVRQGNDYRVLQPYLMMDPNRNRSQVAFDALGLVAGAAVMGKPEQRLGDSLDGFDPDLPEETVLDHLRNPLKDPYAILQGATTRRVYDMFAYMRSREERTLPLGVGRSASGRDPRPTVVYTLARETHLSDLSAGELTKVQHVFSYSDGFGRTIQAKLQAEPGPIEANGLSTDPRWIGSGWTIYNSKGQPVRQYEPFFSATYGFEFDQVSGVSAVLYYDPIGRAVAKLHADHTYEKTVFDAWRQETWDASDNILQLDPAEDPVVGDFFRRLPAADYLPGWYERRENGALGIDARNAAEQSTLSAATPSVAFIDSLGRAFLTVAHNRLKRNDIVVNEMYADRVHLDVQGNHRSVVDSLGRVVVTEEYDVLGRRLHQQSMDNGETWGFADIQGQRIHAWNSRGYHNTQRYDSLRRPTSLLVSHGHGRPKLVGRTVYGEVHPNAIDLNLRGKPYLQLDQSSVSYQAALNPRTSLPDAYDFKGNLLASRRQFAREYKDIIDWTGMEPLLDVQTLNISSLREQLAASLEPDDYQAFSKFDALNRVISITAPDGSVISTDYNVANLMDRLDVRVRGSEEPAPFVRDVLYNARGQRDEIEYGNHAKTRYGYDPDTFRLAHLATIRRDVPVDARRVQDLRYTYDPIGNITHIEDVADIHDVVFFRNRRVTPSADYRYDAIARLIEATGREHLGQAGGAPRPPGPNNSAAHIGVLAPADGSAMGRYTEHYEYDSVGNILNVNHRTDSGGWTRRYTYGESSNRLTETHVGDIRAQYHYDAQGNMTGMPYLSRIQWDFANQLHVSERQVVTDGDGERTYHVYDASGQRVRKVTEKSDGVRRHERLYLGAFEVYRKYDGRGENRTVVRETLHVTDDTARIALIESTVLDLEPKPGTPPLLIRYQFSNHIGSAALELDDHGAVITYEEYYPFGATSYLGGRNLAEVSEKRYRFLGNERDEETGLDYCGARHYASWLGRWINCDPAGLVDGLNLYAYSQANPINLSDPGGTDSTPHPKEEELQQSIPELHGTPREEEEMRSIPEEHPTEAEAPAPPPPPPVAAPAAQAPAPPPARPAEDPWYRFTYPGFYYQAGSDDAFQPVGRYESGNIGLNVVANLYLTVSNLCTIPINAVTEAAALPDHAIRAMGGSETDVGAWHFTSMMIGVGEVNALGEMAVASRTMSELRVAATDARAASAMVNETKAAVTVAEAAPAVNNIAQAAPAATNIIDTSVLIHATKGSQNALNAIRSGNPVITFSQLREFLDVSTEVQQTQLAQFLLEEKVMPLSTQYGQLNSPQMRDLFWRIAKQQGTGDTTGDAALVIHGLQSGYTIITGDGRLIRTIENTLHITGVKFQYVAK